MAREELSINVTAKDDASKVLENVRKKVDKLEGEKAEIKVGADTDQAERDIQGLLGKVDKLGAGQAANLLLTTNASQITGELADLVIKLDTLDANDPQVDITVANIAQLQGDLDAISAKAKEINDTPIRLDTSGATQGIDEIGKSADSSKSVLANMVGNATQDLGSLGGIAGSAGVAIGQMGEYMVDAANSGDKMGQIIKNFGAIAGPIAGITAAIQFVSAVVGVFKDEAAAAKERTDDLGKAMQEAGDDALGFADVLRGDVDELEHFNTASSELFGEWGVRADALLNKIPLFGQAFGDAGDDIIDVAERAGLSIYELGQVIEAGGEFTGDLKTQLDAARDAGKITSDEYDALSETMDTYGDSAENAARKAGLFAVDQAEANAMLQDLVKQADPLKAFAKSFKTIMDDIADGSIDTGAAAAAINRVSDALGIPPSEVISMALDGIADSADKVTPAAERAAADLQVMADTFDAVGEAEDKAAQKAKDLDKAFYEASGGLADAIDAADSFADALGRLNQTKDLDFSLMALNTVDSFDAMKEAIEGTKDIVVDWATVDLTPDSVDELKGIPDELAAVTAAMSGMRSTIQTELTAAFETGGIDAYTDKADFFRTQVLDQFPAAFEAMGASTEEATAQAQALADELGLLPEDVEIMIRLTREEEARATLENFRGFIDELPESKAVLIRTAMSEGDVGAALMYLNRELIERDYPPIELPIDADIAEAESKVEEVITFADGSTGVVTIDGDPDPATGKVGGVVSFIDGSTGTVQIDGNPDPATGKVGGVITYADGSTGTVTIDADDTDAWTKVDELTAPKTLKVYVDVVGGGRGSVGLAGDEGVTMTTTAMALTAAPAATAAVAVPAPMAAAVPIVINTPPLPPANITINAGVIGNRFDVARAVGRAQRDLERLTGTRR